MPRWSASPPRALKGLGGTCPHPGAGLPGTLTGCPLGRNPVELALYVDVQGFTYTTSVQTLYFEFQRAKRSDTSSSILPGITKVSQDWKYI